VPITAGNPFKWRHYPGDIIMWCVRWYLRYPISAARMGEMTKERGLAISPSCVWRWVQIYGRELDQRCRSHVKPTNKSWRLYETYIKVKGQERFLYRAVDSTGQTIDFLLTGKGDAAAAKRFFRRALAHAGNPTPRVINVDKNRAYPLAVEKLKRDGTISRRCRLRQCKYLNNIVEQDHRNVKRRTWLAKGYGSVATAWRTLRGIEAMDLIRKGRVRRAGKGDVVAQVKFISKLFGIAV
jgi:IS6 family transposase